MPITLNGNGSLTGVSVGGLPDGIVDTDMLAADSVTASKIGSKTFTSYAVLADVKGVNADGGTFTAGAWRTRDLNTEITDPDGIVSISSNQFTLAAGTYFIEGLASACQVNAIQTRIYNATDSSVVQLGTAEYAGSGSNHPTQQSFVKGRVTISGTKAFELQHYCTTTQATYGMGVGVSGGFNLGTTTIFTLVTIHKEA